MSSLKILVAAVAAATFGLAIAQGTPPQPATDPAVGAGQRSTQNTPMGTTGTPGGGAAAQGTTGASGAAAATAGSTAGGTSAGMGTTAGGTAAATTDTPMGTSRKTAKADRN